MPHFDYPDISLANVVKRSEENPQQRYDDEWWEIMGGPTTTGARVTERTSLGYSPVWRGISVIGQAVAKLPCITYKHLPDDRGKERDLRHPAYRILKRRASRFVPINQLFSRLTADTILHGNGYALIRLDARMAPTSLERLDPRQVEPPDSLRSDFYRYTQQDGGVRFIPWDQLIHIRFNTADTISGYGLIDLARESLGLGISARTFGSTFFGNASTPSSVYTVPHRLTDKQKGDLRKEFEVVHKGLGRSHKVAFIEGGGELKPISVTPHEAQLLELRAFEVREVANFLNLPPNMLGDDAKSSFASLEMEAQSFLDNSLDPWLTIWEFELNEKLLTSAQRASESHDISFLRQALVRADMKARSGFYTALLTNGVMTRNEVRRLEDLNALDGLDEPLEPLNMAEAGERDDNGSEDTAARTLAVDALRRFAKRAETLISRGEDSKLAELGRQMARPALYVLGHEDRDPFRLAMLSKDENAIFEALT